MRTLLLSILGSIGVNEAFGNDVIQSTADASITLNLLITSVTAVIIQLGSIYLKERYKKRGE